MSKLYVDEIAENSIGNGIRLGGSIKNNVGNDLISSSGLMSSNVSFPSGYFIPLKGVTTSNGGTGSGSDVDMLSLTINLTGYTDYLLFAWCHTSISEQSNTSDTSRVRIKLTDGGSNTTYFASQRQGAGVNGGFGGDAIAYIGCQGYFMITSTYAKSCTLTMNGGINGGAPFNWGDQSSYSNFDNESPLAGGTLGYILHRV